MAKDLETKKRNMEEEIDNLKEEISRHESDGKFVEILIYLLLIFAFTTKVSLNI